MNSIAIIARGASVENNKNTIVKYIENNNSMIIYLNAHEKNVLESQTPNQYYFFSRENSYEHFLKNYKSEKIIYLSGIGKKSSDLEQYSIAVKEICRTPEHIYNDGTIWVLNMINAIVKNKEIVIAGFDGGGATKLQIEKYRKYIRSLREINNIHFITKSVFDNEV